MMTFDLENMIVYLEVVGQPTLQDIQGIIATQINHADYHEGMHELWDFRQASMGHMSEHDFRLLADFVKKTFPSTQKRIAFLVNDSLSFGMGRMWITIAELTGTVQERRLFESMDDAKNWLINSSK